MEERPKYFEEALSNFIHDAASGGAIRHLVDAGYSVDQIVRQLDYPTPRSRVVKTVYQYMTESGILLNTLPLSEEKIHVFHLHHATRRRLSETLRGHIVKNGIEHSYMLCPFGGWIRKNDADHLKQLSCLTGREREYILGIPWQTDIMYHRLTDRMLEIGMELAIQSVETINFYFLIEQVMITTG